MAHRLGGCGLVQGYLSEIKNYFNLTGHAEGENTAIFLLLATKAIFQ
jgi:hypothetical protein